MRLTRSMVTRTGFLYTRWCFSLLGAVNTNPVPQPRAISPVTTPTPTTPPVTAPAVTTPPTLATVPPTTSPATTAPPPSSFTGVNPAPIASNFNATGMIGSGWPIPVSTASEPSGAFRFFCNVSHLSYDDPIVYPGQTGKAHLHMFFGNTGTNAFSTYESLRTTGDGTCHGGPLNRSAYWAPVVLNGDGNVVMPDFILNYYKGMGGTAETIAGLPVLPAGLRMIAGYDMNNPSAVTSTFWYCESIGPNATNPQYSKTIIACPAGDRVIARVAFPMCWDGVHLDSPNHRSHMSYEVWDGYGHSACPSTHPVRLAEYSMGIFWPSDGKVGSWKLSSDTMPGMTHAPGSTFHADWFGAWDPGVMQTWMRECVNKMRSCNSGELGDGSMLQAADDYVGPATIEAPPKGE